MKLRPLACLAATLTLVLSWQSSPPPDRVGPLPANGFLLNSGWTIRPAGDQVPVGTLPLNAVVSKDGRFLLVLNCGYDRPTLSVINLAEKREVQRASMADAWLGLTLSPKGDTVYVGGGTRAQVHQFSFNTQTGELTPSGELNAVADLSQKGLSFIGDVQTSADGHFLYAADLHLDAVAVINLRSGVLLGRWKVARRPYRILLHPDNQSFFLSSWADAAVYQYNASSGELINVTRVGPHPTDLLFVNQPAPSEEGQSYPARLFVAASNTNNVYSFGVSEDKQLHRLESINLAYTPLHPLGMTPSALAVAENKTLYVACSDANAIAAVDISQARSHVEGFIPTGWYPTGVVVTADRQLAIVSGKGLGSHPNPHGPSPIRRPAPTHEGTAAVEYVGHIQNGTVGLLPMPDTAQLDQLSHRFLDNSPYRDDSLVANVRGVNLDTFVNQPGHPSPLQHIIYIIKENRTYDQVLGDLGIGNGDKSLTLFGDEVTPNLHALARQFVLYDNFYENSDVSADGHNWAAAAIAPDYTQRLWPNSYGHRRHTYDYEGGEPANTPPAGYVWNNAMQAGVSVRNYGEWVENVPLDQVQNQRHVAIVRDPALAPVTDLNYRSFDLDYPDVDRVKEFLREWKQFDDQGKAPQLMLVRLGNDHTSGMAPRKIAPLAANADNDYAVGLLVDAVSHSKLWASTAIFIIEDDAQNGPDHVDSHRAPAFVISPFTRRGIVDSTMYNQMSILRTIEGLLGLRPLTHFDAAATTMFGSFALKPDLRPFSAISPRTSLTERNPGSASHAAETARLDFSEADRVDDEELNGILWRALKRTEPPSPVRSAFAR